jgi:hypothetical protein
MWCEDGGGVLTTSCWFLATWVQWAQWWWPCHLILEPMGTPIPLCTLLGSLQAFTGAGWWREERKRLKLFIVCWIRTVWIWSPDPSHTLMPSIKIRLTFKLSLHVSISQHLPQP